MSDQLPELIDPLLFAIKERKLTGEIELRSFLRLTDILAGHEGLVNIDLLFAKEGKFSRVYGQIETVLLLECQNCLEIVEFPVKSNFKLGIVSSLEEVNLLPDNFEPLLISEQRISLNEIIEEELLLSIPAFPKHSGPCAKYKTLAEFYNTEENGHSNTDNPFSILAKLKNTGDK